MTKVFIKIILFFNLSMVAFAFLIGNKTIANQEIYITADKITSDDESGIIDAFGNVILIDDDGNKMRADSVSYDQKNNQSSASGNVIISDPPGNTYFMKEVNTKDGLNNLIGQNIKSRMNDGTRVVGSNIFKQDNITVLNDAEYTPCKENEYLIKNCPGWKLKSKKIYQDAEKKTVYYDHAKLHLFNLPILYLPYFSHPDPSVNKRTGFLMPTIQTDKNLGNTFSLPYFINIADNKDLTFTPNFQSKENNFYSFDYRHLNDLGMFNIDGSIDDNDDGEGTSSHIYMDSEIFNQYGSLNAFFKKSNNDTYLRKNKINQLTVHESGIKFFRETNDTYLSATASAYKHLTIQNSNQWEYLYPNVNYNINNLNMEILPGRLSINNDFSYRKNLDDSYITLASTQANWDNNYVDKSLGLLFDNSASFRVVSISNDNKNENDTENIRFFPQISSRVSYPLFKSQGSSNHTLTPIIMPIIAPYNNYTEHQSITNSNLFSKNRASSIFQSESGPRINWGLEWFLQHKNDFDIKITGGQSLRFNKHKEDTTEEVSDYYVSSSLIIDDNKYLNNSIIIDKDNRDIKTHNSNLLVALDDFSLGVDYDYNSGKYYTASEQIRIGSKFKFYDNFELNLTGQKDLDKNKNIGYQYGLLYENDCLGIDLNFYRDLTKDRDVAESYGYSFTIVLKPFGTTKKYGKTKVFGPKI